MRRLQFYKNDKKEKGAITLFVLLACLFFMFILMGVYLSLINRAQVQEQEVQQIKENYAKDIERVDEIYEDLAAANIIVTLEQTINSLKEVTLTGKATISEINESSDIKIVGYLFNQDETGDNIKESDWNALLSTDNPKDITKETTKNDNGTYYFWVLDSEGEKHRSNGTVVDTIDNNLPTAGTLIATEQDEDGTEVKEYDLINSPWTGNDVYIEKVDGTDGEGESTTTYTVKKGTLTIYEDIEEPTTLTETGKYTVTVKTTDEAGNFAENVYIININKIVPVLALKYNDANGADYDGSWTKDNLYGEITFDTSSTGKEVEKYQYSENEIIWNDISSERIQTSIDYTTTFPMSGDKPDWISGPVNNGTYYFEVQADGTLKPSNGGNTGSTNSNTKAESYFEIDLTEYAEAELELTLNATISSENNYDFGYAEITESTDAISFSKGNEYFIKVSGTTTTANHTTTITGGKKYYLHIGYYKDSSQSSNQDTFIINSITLKSEQLGNGINFANYSKTGNTVTFTLEEHLEKEKIYVRAIYTEDGRASEKGKEKTIKIDRKAPTIENTTPILLSREDAKLTVNATDEGSGVKGYYISTGTTSPTESSTWISQTMSEFTIENLKASTTYYLWMIDKVGNISERQTVVIGTANYSVDDTIYTETLAEAITAATNGSVIKLLGNYTDTSTATFSKSVTFDIQSYTLTRSSTITVNSEGTVEITGTGKITSGTSSVRTITNSGTLTISNSVTLENKSTSTSYAPIYNSSSSAIINIEDNVQILGYYRGIYNYYGTLNVKGGKIESTYSSSSSYGIYNYSSSAKTYITNGEIKGYYGIRNNNSSSIVEMTGGKVIGTGAYGIYAIGTTNIYGGRVEGKTYGLYSSSSNKITIGREEDELSTTNPAIYGATYGVGMSSTSYSFNFYNGVLIGNTETTTYNGELNPRTNHMPYTYYDEEDFKYHTILVEKVDNITMEATPTEYTNGDVVVKITYPYNDNIKQYSEDGVTWQNANGYIQYVTVTENKIIYARLVNESVVILDENQITVDNIDKERPTVSVSPTQTNYTVTSSNGTVNLNLTLTASDIGVSGLDKVQYAWVAEGEEIEYIDFDSNGTTITKNNLAIGQYNLYFNVTDKAGNKSETTQIRYNVKYGEPVCKIGSTTYTTVQAAVNVCSKSAGNTQTTIIMLKSTDEEFTTYAGQNIILDLKGYTIGSSNLETPLCTNNAKLLLTDSSSGKTGKLESINNICVVNNGTFTLGTDNGTIEYEVPTIYGYKKGIVNNGTFNFYDGKIQGITPIDGDVNDTPDDYGPVSTDITNGITTMQLGIITGYEARIDWVYYEKLEDAISVAKTQETVTILKNLQKQAVVVVDESKDIKLDLDGYELTVTGVKTVLQNNGKLEILDGSTGKTGAIKMTSTGTSYAINNKGELTIAGGTISGQTYAVYNNGGDVTITAGTIQGNNNYAVYNYTGNIVMNGGTINNSTYGIYNAQDGIICMNGGTITTAFVSYNYQCYGIYNSGSGKIKVTGGKINIDCPSNFSNRTANGIYNINGELELLGGTIEGITLAGADNYIYGIYNIDGNARLNGITINLKNTTGENNLLYGIMNKSNGNIIIQNSNITVIESNTSATYCWDSFDMGNYTGGEVYGIYNYSKGKVQFIQGTITVNTTNISLSSSSDSYRNCYGIFNKSTGTIIVGNSEQTSVTQTPVVIGKYVGSSSYDKHFCYGIFNACGEFEFYNGLIQGTELGLTGNITKIRDGYTITETTKSSMNSIYLSKDSSTKQYIAQIDSTSYYTLQEAVDSIGENEQKTIKILRSFTLGQPVKFDKNVILNLNGYTITNKYYQIANIGNLKITGASGKITFDETVTGIVNKENGNLEWSSGTLVTTSGLSNSFLIYTAQNATTTISGGTLNATSAEFRRGISGLHSIDNANIKITGGTINSVAAGISSSSNGKIEMTGGTISVSSYDHHSFGICIESNQIILDITGGAINCTASINNCIGIEIFWAGKINIKNLTMTCRRTSYEDYDSISFGIENSDASIEISDSTITVTDSYKPAYGISNGTGETTILDGTNITVTGSRDVYGIYSDYSDSKITIGTKGDENVSTTSPYIKVTRNSSSYVGYGIYNTVGTFNFYDGKIQGSTKAVYDSITEREDNTELNYQSNETILTLSTSPIPVAQIGSTQYNTLQSAINAAGTTQTTIQLLRNVTYTNNDALITVPSNKNIILDINGYTITSAIEEALIQNNGRLEITNSGASSSIISTTENTIINSSGATLTISGANVTIEGREQNTINNQGTLNVTNGTIYMYFKNNEANDIFGIYNTGTVNISGGIIKTSNSSNAGGTTYGIFNAGTGTVTVSRGTFSLTNSYDDIIYGIYNATTGNIIMTGGTIGTCQYGIYNANTGSITLGVKGDGTPASGSPSITASKKSEVGGYGIHNLNGTLNYYDGTIKGSVRAIYGNISEVEELTELSITTSGSYEQIKLATKTTNAASVNGVEYDSIQKAINACGTTASTVTVLRNTDPSATIIVGSNQNITLNLNNYTVTNYTELQNKGTLIITDNSSGATGKIVGKIGVAVNNTGNMQLNGGIITNSGYGIKNSGTLSITGGTISSNTHGIYNESNGVTNVQGGTVSSNTYGVYGYSGTINVTGTAITSNTYGIYNLGAAVNVKENATIQSETGIYNQAGIVVIGEQGTVNTSTPVVVGTKYGLSNDGIGLVYFYDGKIQGKSGATYGYITYTQSGYIVNTTVDGEYFTDVLALAGTISAVAEVNGVSYSNLQSAINSIVGEEAKTIKLTNGIITTATFRIAEGQNIILDMNQKTISSDLDVTINNAGNLTIIDSTSSGVGKISSTTGIAIVNSGTLSLGQDDGTVSQELITIEGQTYGIENTGTLNFYDGTINGGSAVSGIVTNRANGYAIRTTTVNGKERYYLSK